VASATPRYTEVQGGVSVNIVEKVARMIDQTGAFLLDEYGLSEVAKGSGQILQV
jgi:hypothetical protein